MRKHIFETSNIFCIYIKKERSKHVRVLAICNTQENIFLKKKPQASQLNTRIAIKGNQSSHIF